jgi:hypothetical protein
LKLSVTLKRRVSKRSESNAKDPTTSALKYAAGTTMSSEQINRRTTAMARRDGAARAREFYPRTFKAITIASIIRNKIAFVIFSVLARCTKVGVGSWFERLKESISNRGPGRAEALSMVSDSVSRVPVKKI